MTSEQHPAIDSVQPSDVPDVSRSPPEANMDKTDMLEDLAKRVVTVGKCRIEWFDIGSWNGFCFC